MAYRPRPEAPAQDPARRRRELGRRRGRGGLGHERFRRPRVPDRSEHERGARRQTDGRAPATVAVGGAPPGSASPGRRAGTALPSSVCSKIVSGGEPNPRFLIVSDFPLKGSEIAQTHQMVEAIRLVLERRGYRAGAYTIGTSPATTRLPRAGGWDRLRCYEREGVRAEPRRDRHRRLVQLRLLGTRDPGGNQAANGPLAMISPVSTLTTLTRLLPGHDTPNDLERLYPTDERNFVRTAAASHLTAAAMAQFAKQKGVKRLFLSWEREHLLRGYAADVRSAALSLGIRIAGAVPYNPDARNHDRFARRIASTRADGVVLSGIEKPRTPALLRALRAVLGRSVTLIGGENFQPTVELAGLAASGCTTPTPARTSRSSPGRKAVPGGSEPAPASRASSTPPPPPSRPRSCSARSPAPTAPAPRSPRSCSRRESRTASSATSASTRTATRSRHPPPSGAWCAPRAPNGRVADRSSSGERHCFPSRRANWPSQGPRSGKSRSTTTHRGHVELVVTAVCSPDVDYTG